MGLGYVGLPLALLAAKKSFSVTGIDFDKNKVSAVNAHKDPIGDEYIAKLIKDTKTSRLKTILVRLSTSEYRRNLCTYPC